MIFEDSTFSNSWHMHDEFDFSHRQPDFCTHAAQFQEWAEQLIAEIRERSTEPAVRVGKLLLLDRYWTFYRSVPKVHKNHIGTREGHFCIFQVFQHAYNVLHKLELSLEPPRLSEPPSPEMERVARLTQVPALFLGEIEE